jgi:protein TonB
MSVIKASHVSATWISAAVFAATITLALFMIMQALISNDFEQPEEVTYRIPEIRMPEDPKVEERYEQIKKPEDAVEPPPPVPNLAELDLDPGTGIPAIQNHEIPMDDFTIVNTRNVPLAHVLVRPTYPARATARGIEGFALVRFDVTSTGSTENIVVLSAQPKGYFESAAKKAVEKWRFQPVTDRAGEPKPFQGLTHRIVFQMEK